MAKEEPIPLVHQVQNKHKSNKKWESEQSFRKQQQQTEATPSEEDKHKKDHILLTKRKMRVVVILREIGACPYQI